MGKKKVLSLVAVLTLLVVPETPARTDACQVLSAKEGRVILRCSARQDLQADDWIRLHAVNKKAEEGC